MLPVVSSTKATSTRGRAGGVASTGRGGGRAWATATVKARLPGAAASTSSTSCRRLRRRAGVYSPLCAHPHPPLEVRVTVRSARCSSGGLTPDPCNRRWTMHRFVSAFRSCRRGPRRGRLRRQAFRGPGVLPGRPRRGQRGPPAGDRGHGSVGFMFDGATVSYSIRAATTPTGSTSGPHPSRPRRRERSRPGLPYPSPPRGPQRRDPRRRHAGWWYSGTFTAADVGGGLTFTDMLGPMRTGTAYCNIHTRHFPGGEIRGQVRPISVD